MSVRLSTLPSLAVIGVVLVLGTTGASVGAALVTHSGTTGGSTTVEDVDDDSPRTEPLGRDDGVKLRRSRERDASAD